MNIPQDKGFLLLEGDGASQTLIEWRDFAPGSHDNQLILHDSSESRKVAASATFTVSAANIVVKGITFKVFPSFFFFFLLSIINTEHRFPVFIYQCLITVQVYIT